MALRGRAIPNRPIMSHPQAGIPPGPPAVRTPHTKYIVRPVFTGRPQAKATIGGPYLPTADAPPTATRATTYFVKPVFTGRPSARLTVISPQRVAVAVAAIVRKTYLVKPVFTGRAQAKFTVRTVQSSPQVPAVRKTSYLVKPVFTGPRPIAKATVVGLPPAEQVGFRKPLVPNIRSTDRTLRQHTDVVAQILNSLIRQGILVQTSDVDWELDL